MSAVDRLRGVEGEFVMRARTPTLRVSVTGDLVSIVDCVAERSPSGVGFGTFVARQSCDPVSTADWCEVVRLFCASVLRVPERFVTIEKEVM